MRERVFPPGDNELVVRERVFLPGDDEFASRGRGGGFGDVGSTAARLRVERTTYIYIYIYIYIYRSLRRYSYPRTSTPAY